MRRLSATAATLSTCAVLMAALAVPASAHDGGQDDRSGRGHDDAVAAAPMGATAPTAESSDDDADDAMDDDALDDADDAMDDGDDDMEAAEDDGTEFEADLTGSSVGGPVIAKAAAGSRPWVITEGEVEFEDGMIDAVIDGLVIPPANTNPVAALSISVVCGGEIVATTATVPFSTAGDAMVHQALTVPDVCAMPQVLVHPGANKLVYIAFG